ncbi:MAG: TetR-like C-terminal domain-containing protein [Huintestinicola sp.]
MQKFYDIRDSKPFVMNVYHCVSWEQVEKYLSSLTDNLIMGVINELSDSMIVREDDKVFIARIYSYAFVGLMLDWIKDDMKESPEDLVNRFAMVIQDNISGALERFRVDKNSSYPTV